MFVAPEAPVSLRSIVRPFQCTYKSALCKVGGGVRRWRCMSAVTQAAAGWERRDRTFQRTAYSSRCASATSQTSALVGLADGLRLRRSADIDLCRPYRIGWPRRPEALD